MPDRFRVDEQMTKGYAIMQVEIYIKRGYANQDQGMRSIDKSMGMSHFQRQSAGQEAFSMLAQALEIGQCKLSFTWLGLCLPGIGM